MSQERTEPPKSAPEVMRRIMDAQGEIDRLNATIAGLQAAVKEQTAKVQERDKENERMRREQGLTIAQQFKEIERLRAGLSEAQVNVQHIRRIADFGSYTEKYAMVALGAIDRALKGAE